MKIIGTVESICCYADTDKYLRSVEKTKFNIPFPCRVCYL